MFCLPGGACGGSDGETNDAGTDPGTAQTDVPSTPDSSEDIEIGADTALPHDPGSVDLFDPGEKQDSLIGSDQGTDPETKLEVDEGPAGGPVELSGVFNARHTGGLKTPDGKRVRDNVLIRSGHLGGLDATGCQQFQALGIRTVIDLRMQAEADGTPGAACSQEGTDYHLAELPKILPPSEQSYLDTLEAAESALAGIFGQMAVDDGLPAIIHCVIGRDRASLMMALVLLALGVPADQVLIDFTDNQEATVEASWLQAALDRINQEGGIESYLAKHGVTSVQVSKLKYLALE